MLINYLDKYAGNVAILGEGKTIYFHELKARIIEISEIFRNLKIKPGDRIGLCGVISVDYICFLFAILYHGAVGVLLNTRQTVSQIQQSADSVKLKLIFTTEDWQTKIKPARRMQMFNVQKKAGTRPVNRVGMNQDATIIFTSGSSNGSKAVLHTFGNHYANASGANANIPLEAGDRWLMSLPVYHIGGLAICIRTLISGAAMVIPDKSLSIESLINKYSITHLSLVPTQLYRLLRSPEKSWVNSLKAILLGGAPISGKLVKEAGNKHLPIFTSYGSTEMSSQVTTTRKNSGYDTLCTAGYILPDRKLKISDEGEIFVGGPTLAKGYVRHYKIRSLTDREGWFHTGDRGKIDRKGRLTVLGRLDNMFISGGENIYPEEIEIILTAFEGVEEAVVVPVPDEEFGERPAAFIRWYEPHLSNFEGIKAYSLSHIAGYMQPVKWFNFPQPGKKLKADRRELKRIACRDLSRSS